MLLAPPALLPAPPLLVKPPLLDFGVHPLGKDLLLLGPDFAAGLDSEAVGEGGGHHGEQLGLLPGHARPALDHLLQLDAQLLQLVDPLHVLPLPQLAVQQLRPQLHVLLLQPAHFLLRPRLWGFAGPFGSVQSRVKAALLLVFLHCLGAFQESQVVESAGLADLLLGIPRTCPRCLAVRVVGTRQRGHTLYLGNGVGHARVVPDFQAAAASCTPDYFSPPRIELGIGLADGAPHVIIIILFRVNQRQAIQQYLYSSSMKTSEIKSFAVHLNRPAKPALFKSQLNQIFTPEDAPTILAVHGALREARELGRSIPESILGLNYELIGRLRQYIEEQSRPDSHKFREVRSAKKLKPATPSACDGFSEFEEHRPIRLKPLKLMSENKELVTNKENKGIFTELRPLGWTEKPKLRKLPEIKSQVPKAKKEEEEQRGEDVDRQLETLKQMEAKVSEQNRKLRSMLNQMQGKSEPCQLDVKVWLHFQEATQPQEEGMHMDIRIPGSPGQVGKGSEESVDGDLVAHLQMIMVSQQRQIEALQHKLVESFKGAIGMSKGKPERWNNY